MLKRDEKADPNSCLNQSRADEPLFVLCGRDPFAPDAVAYWAYLKAGGVPLPFLMPAAVLTPKVENAMACASEMEEWRKEEQRKEEAADQRHAAIVAEG